MKFPLWRKELREQRPFLAFGLFFAGVELIDAAQKGFDAMPLGRAYDSSCDDSVMLVMFFAFALGTGLLVREQDEGTLAFLDGLPISRGQVFATKLATSWAVLMVYPVLKVVAFTGLHLLSRGVLNHAVHPHVLLGHLAVSAMLAATALSVGLWLGFFRSLAWSMLALLVTGQLLAQREWPVLAALNPADLCQLRLVGAHPKFEASALWGPLGLSSLSLGLAWLLFVGRWSRTQQLLKGLGTRPVLGGLLVSGLLVVALVVYGMVEKKSDRPPTPDSEGPPKFSEGAPAFRQTRHYRFHYPSTVATAALALADQGDHTFEEVHRLLGVEPGEAIDVDLSGSMQNTAGTAFHERIRIDLAREPLETLAHETAHVVAARLAGGADNTNLLRMRVFDEGLAHWVGRRFRQSYGVEADRLIAAAMHSRGEVLMDEMLDEKKLAKARDERIKYVLGAALVEALVSQAGPLGPRKVLEAAGSKGLRLDLDTAALNQAVFQLAGFDLALVFDVMFRTLEKDAAELKAQISRLPRPRTELLVAEHGWYGVRAIFDAELPKGWAVAVRFRPRADSNLRDYRTERPVNPKDPAWRHRSALARGEVCFQAGIEGPGEVTLFEPWQCVSQDSATDWKPSQSGTQTP